MPTPQSVARACQPVMQPGRVSLPSAADFAYWLAVHRDQPIRLTRTLPTPPGAELKSITTDAPFHQFLLDAGAPAPRLIAPVDYTDDRRCPGTAPFPRWAARFHEQCELLVYILNRDTLTAVEAVRLVFWLQVKLGSAAEQPELPIADTRDQGLFGGTDELRHRPGYVYLVRAASGLYKIGRAADPGERLRELACGSPDELRLVHAIAAADCVELETRLHRRFALQRVRGEWFQLDAVDVAWLRELREWPGRGR